MNRYDHNYSAYFVRPSADYPEGSAVDASSEDNLDGTPLRAAFFNDVIGFFQAAFHRAFGNPFEGGGVERAVSGADETARASDVLDALEAIEDRKIAAEKAGRESADAELSDALSAEAAAREGADAELSDALSAEAAAREGADAELSAEIERVKSAGGWCPFPVGATYTQFPGCAAPGDLWQGTAWTRLSFGGSFFRAEGGDAVVFGGEQAEGLPNITGGFSAQVAETSGRCYGAFWKDTAIRGYSDSGRSSNSYEDCFGFSAASANPIYGRSRHVTPYNRTIRIWRRTR